VLNDRVVLITGGTGSFGEAMVDRLLRGAVSEIRIFSRDEEKQEAMRTRRANPKLKFYIGDVRDRPSVDAAMQGVDLVFHAAALKQVPSCEFFPLEAVRTNILGSANVLESAAAARVKSVVCLSTDKAVMPINTMGMTKAVMEKVAQATARRLTETDTLVCAVRYGNVMYSRGSVIPLFVNQIRQGQRLTITDPSMTRFMLPLSEAVELVEFAFENGRQGDVFVRKAPACTVGDLAKALCELFDVDCDINVIGIRHGEKIYETLATAEELRRAEDMGRHFRIPMDTRDLNYAIYYTDGETVAPDQPDYHSHNAVRLSVPEVISLLRGLPELRQMLKDAAR
jgi:UDP-N-acetylglucosamine 4,6-dehydratase/5-epimerase